MRKGYSSGGPPKCPAVIFNNSGSMMAIGRVEKTMDIISDAVRNSETGIDYYISDERTGIPFFITHLADEQFGSHSAPLIPLITGDDYMNPLALAAIISEYPAGVHLIDDGDSIMGAITEALHLLKDRKNPAYMNPVTYYFVRGQGEQQSVNRAYENFIAGCPEESGFNLSMYHAIPDAPERDRRLPY
jgi:hypothetical protein